MTAMDERRRLLDERGVEWWPISYDGTQWDSPSRKTQWTVYPDEFYKAGTTLKLRSTALTADEIVDATLGAGTCHVETTENWLPAERYHRCKYCGAFFAVLDANGDIPPRVCPNCGRKVVEQ